MEFKKLEIKPEGPWIKRVLSNPHTKKSLLYTLIGAIGGFAFYYFTEGNQLDAMPKNDIYESVLMGAFLGFFVTNSPCARGKC